MSAGPNPLMSSLHLFPGVRDPGDLAKPPNLLVGNSCSLHSCILVAACRGETEDVAPSGGSHVLGYELEVEGSLEF